MQAGEGGGEEDGASASARLSQYWDGEEQEWYQVTPIMSQHFGTPLGLHVYVSEHSLQCPVPCALGASHLPMMSVPSFLLQLAATEQTRATSMTASKRLDAARFRCVPAACALERCRQASAFEVVKRLT